MTDKVPHIYTALEEVRKYVEQNGIAKERESKQGDKYPYRGIDDVLNFFSKPMVLSKMMFVPGHREMVREASTTRAGGAKMTTTVYCTIRLLSLVDGSEIIAGPFLGEAMDVSDKSASKAMSVALRNGMLQTFCVPLGAGYDPEEGEDDDDGDQGDREEPTLPKDDGPVEVAEDVSDSQMRWLNGKIDAAGTTLEKVLKKHGRISKANIRQIGESL